MLDAAVSLLKRLISAPSVSRNESQAADVAESFLKGRGVEVHRFHNNLWALNRRFNPNLPTLMLNSHLDTVKPVESYSIDPYTPFVRDGRLYGLGSNDAGASVVSLAATFCALNREPLPVNLLLALTAEEEVMGEKGMRAFLPEMEAQGVKIDMAIVGEPTGMLPAVAERGLVVLDGVARGVAGHAARNEGVNALYLALDDIQRLRNFRFERESSILGPVKVSVTQIQAGSQHNVVPAECRYVVDVRTTDAYTNEQTVELLQSCLHNSETTPRSTRIRASVIDPAHPLVVAARELCGEPFVSPTTSDMALMYHFPSLKIGPGQSRRSHSADEYVAIAEIEQALQLYPQLITSLKA